MKDEMAQETELSRIDELAFELDRVKHAARVDIENLQADVIAKNREIGRLKAQLTEFTDGDDEASSSEVAALLELWWREVMNANPRVHYGLSSTRAPVVRAAIKRRKKPRKGGGGDNGGLEICRKAVLGAVFDDWAMGRDPRSNGRSFNDVAKHILKTDDQIERFAKLHDRFHRPRDEQTRAMIRSHPNHPMRIALEGLRNLGAGFEPAPGTRPGEFVAQCPFHGTWPWSLHVFMAGGRCHVVCDQACDEYALLITVGFTGPSEWSVR
jgi:hypothetical protein